MHESGSVENISVITNEDFIKEKIQKPVEGVEIKQKYKRKTSWTKLLSLGIIVISLGLLISGGVFVISSASKVGDVTNEGWWSVIKGGVKGAISGERAELKGEKDGRTNILVLGVDSMANLTDSIMVISYYHDKAKAVAVTIPRDLQVWDQNSSYKVNAMYTFAEQKERGSGADKVASFISEQYDLPIHYWATANFQAVRDIVDIMGGIKVDVERSFTDCRYPKDDYSGVMYPCPTFESGEQKMDGKTALIYARSRHGNNGEGSDFARSRRQTIVIEGIAQKAKEEVKNGRIFSKDKLDSYLDALGKNFSTNMKVAEIMSFNELFSDSKAMESDELMYRINWQVDNKLMCNSRSTAGLYVINYCDGSYPGRDKNSVSHKEAIRQLHNSLAISQYKDLYDAGTIILGNGNPKTKEIYYELKDLGMTVFLNHFYSYIPAGSEDTTVEVFIPNKTIREKFDKLFGDSELSFDYVLKGEIPSDYYLTPNNQDADIIIWISK